MHKHWVCECGHVVHCDSDDEIVKAPQDHMRKVHGKEISRDAILKTTHEHRH